MNQAAMQPSAMIMQDDGYVRFLLEFMLEREGCELLGKIRSTPA